MMRDTTSSYRHELRAWELARELQVPDFRTVDTDDAVEIVEDAMIDVLDELKDVDVTQVLKEQAAHHYGQWFLDALAREETGRLAEGIAGAVSTISDTDKTRLIMVQIPDYIDSTGGGV